jgi:RNA polymerase sigma-70 factor (ECF subfamily)
VTHPVDVGSASDEQLMVMTGAGRQEAFEELVRRHQARVLQIAARAGALSDAEDVAQEVFWSVYRAAPRYRPEAQFSTWLYRIVVNACLSRRRGRVLPFRPQKAGRDPADRSGMVREAIEKLPERQRMAVVLHRFEGLSYKEVAQAMEITETAVESLLARAYRALRDLLKF